MSSPSGTTASSPTRRTGASHPLWAATPRWFSLATHDLHCSNTEYSCCRVQIPFAINEKVSGPE